MPVMLLINVDLKDGSCNGAMGPRYEVPEMLLINVDWKDGSCNGAMGPQVAYISHRVDDTRNDKLLCHMIPSFQRQFSISLPQTAGILEDSVSFFKSSLLLKHSLIDSADNCAKLKIFLFASLITTMSCSLYWKISRELSNKIWFSSLL